MARPRDRKARLAAEPLEARDTPANLAITDVYLVDANDNPVAAPAVGEQVFVHADWTADGTTAADQYTVGFTVDGVELDSGPIANGDGSYDWHLGGWFASPGAHAVEVTVDNTNAVAETDESDNSLGLTFTPAAPDLPEQFTWPLAGTPGVDWMVFNYVDVDPRPGAAADYRGGPYQYDGHDAMDIDLADFAAMDAGVPVYAAAGGTVTATADGNFDRSTERGDAPANYVSIDHGSGWATNYYHLREGTVAVQPGDVVTAGQFLGFAGSSGDSSWPHLHFSVYHNGDVVETNYDPAAYWADPAPYQGDVAPAVMAHGVTTTGLDVPAGERPLPVSTFPTGYTGEVEFWYELSDLRPGDAYDVRWYSPAGDLVTDFPGTASGDERQPRYTWDLSADWADNPGAWTVVLEVNGAEAAEDQFVVTDPGQPVIRVDAGDTFVAAGRSTPIDFSDATPAQTFTVTNVGTDTLVLGAPELPAGFYLAGGFPGAVGPGETAEFTVAVDLSQAGSPGGDVSFPTNDPGANLFVFAVRGTSSGDGPPPDTGAGAGDDGGPAPAETIPGPLPANGFVVASDAGGPPLVTAYNPDGSARAQWTAFDPSFTGGVRAVMADFTGDGVPDVAVGTGPGTPTEVVVYDGATGRQLFRVQPFEAAFTGGVYVAAGDLTGDGKADLVITPDEGGGPRVLVYSGGGFGLAANFFGIDDPDFRGGARAAVADVTGDGTADLVVAAGFGGGPRVSVFDGKALAAGQQVHPFGDFFIFGGPDAVTLRNGVFIAAGDVNGDGFADLVAGGGPGGGPRVLVVDGKSLVQSGPADPTAVANFFAGDPDNRGGVRVAVKNLDGDGLADVVVGDGSGAGSRVTAYAGKDLAAGVSGEAFDTDAFAGFGGGVFVG
jgi:hypothetical protein